MGSGAQLSQHAGPVYLEHQSLFVERDFMHCELLTGPHSSAGCSERATGKIVDWVENSLASTFLPGYI